MGERDEGDASWGDSGKGAEEVDADADDEECDEEEEAVRPFWGVDGMGGKYPSCRLDSQMRCKVREDREDQDKQRSLRGVIIASIGREGG